MNKNTLFVFCFKNRILIFHDASFAVIIFMNYSLTHVINSYAMYSLLFTKPLEKSCLNLCVHKI